MNEAPLRLAAVERRYRTEAGELPVLLGADLTIAAGEIVALVAPSGTGKSTLLHLAGLLEKPDGGEVFISGKAAGSLSDEARTTIRRTTIGFVYQFHHLLPEFTAAENIILPQLAAGKSLRRICLVFSVCRPGWITAQGNYPVVNNSVLQLPAHSPISRGFCWPMNRPVIWMSPHLIASLRNCWNRCAARGWQR
jgi:ABC-type sugar transport system ATPase subunit